MKTSKFIKIATALILPIFMITSCQKKNEDIAGKGGGAVLKITPRHHNRAIDSCTVYLKYNTLDAPAPGTNYDEAVKCVPENGKPVATFSNLKKGKYYIYGYGWDTEIEDTVMGGAPYTISAEQTYELNLAVTEGD